jgi:hypothetical protein
MNATTTKMYKNISNATGLPVATLEIMAVDLLLKKLCPPKTEAGKTLAKIYAHKEGKRGTK